MMDKICVEDIRVGQQVLCVWDDGFCDLVAFVSKAYIAEFDRHGHVHSGEHYLLVDVPKPEFVVPWGTRQVDSLGTVWDFFQEPDMDGLIASNGEGWLDVEAAEQRAPFHRLFTVAELVEVLEDGCGETYLATRLSDLEGEGVL